MSDHDSPSRSKSFPVDVRAVTTIQVANENTFFFDHDRAVVPADVFPGESQLTVDLSADQYLGLAYGDTFSTLRMISEDELDRDQWRRPSGCHFENRSCDPRIVNSVAITLKMASVGVYNRLRSRLRCGTGQSRRKRRDSGIFSETT